MPPAPDRVIGWDEQAKEIDPSPKGGGWRVLCVHGGSGMGKTALVAERLGRLRKGIRVVSESLDEDANPDIVFGSIEQQVARLRRGRLSPKAPAGSDGDFWDRGRRLADAVAESGLVLSIDGLERLQPPGGGRDIRHLGFESLLTHLGRSRAGRGRAVVTAARPLKQLRGDIGPSYRGVPLEEFRSGPELLARHELSGDLEALSNACRHVPYTLRLAAAYLKLAAGQGPNAGRRTDSLAKRLRAAPDPREYIFGEWHRWLAEHHPDALKVLFRAALFRRKVPVSLLAAAEPPETRAGFVDSAEKSIPLLSAAGLLRRTTEGGQWYLDAHASVRESFRVRFRKESDWKVTNERLCTQLLSDAAQEPEGDGRPEAKRPTPGEIRRLKLLYEAARFGCEAGPGWTAKMFREVFLRRIQGPHLAASLRFGWVNENLSLFRDCFYASFDEGTPQPDFEGDAYLLARLHFLAGLDSWHLGDFGPAKRLWLLAERCFRDEGDTHGQADTLRRLGEVSWTSGEIGAALTWVTEACEVSANPKPSGRGRRAERDYLTTHGTVSDCLATWGRALHLSGQYDPAAEKFGDERARDADGSFAYWRNDLLLDRGCYGEVEAWARNAAAEVKREGTRLLDVGHPLLAQALAAWLEAARSQGAGPLREDRATLDRIEKQFAAAVNWLTRSRQLVHLPDAHLKWADFLCFAGRTDEARRLAEDALSLAERVGMPLVQADAHLLLAVVALAEGGKADAPAHLERAGEIIRAYGYGRRQKALDWLRRACSDPRLLTGRCSVYYDAVLHEDISKQIISELEGMGRRLRELAQYYQSHGQDRGKGQAALLDAAAGVHDYLARKLGGSPTPALPQVDPVGYVRQLREAHREIIEPLVADLQEALGQLEGRDVATEILAIDDRDRANTARKEFVNATMDLVEDMGMRFNCPHCSGSEPAGDVVPSDIRFITPSDRPSGQHVVEHTQSNKQTIHRGGKTLPSPLQLIPARPLK
jgi:tetratricopeptide (TPR) repeat protein